MLTFGSPGEYEWLVTDADFDIVQLCPEIVLGKYVAVTSIDSGQLKPTEKETAAGWQSRANIAYSPNIGDPQQLPRAGWDEWHIFTTPADLGTGHLGENVFEVPQEQGHLSVLVNYGFALHLPQRAKDLIDLFWAQMARVRPESYLADNDQLTFVSMNKALFAGVRDAVQALGR